MVELRINVPDDKSKWIPQCLDDFTKTKSKLGEGFTLADVELAVGTHEEKPCIIASGGYISNEEKAQEILRFVNCVLSWYKVNGVGVPTMCKHCKNLFDYCFEVTEHKEKGCSREGVLKNVDKFDRLHVTNILSGELICHFDVVLVL